MQSVMQMFVARFASRNPCILRLHARPCLPAVRRHSGTNDDHSTAPNAHLSCLKIEVIMIPATRIKLHPAGWTRVSAFHISPYAQLRTTTSTKHRQLIPLLTRPNFDVMTRKRLMTILARIVESATLHLDRNHIDRLVVMRATSLRVQIDSVYIRASLRHRYRLEDEDLWRMQ